MFRKLFLKIKRFFFFKLCGFYPEEIKKLIYFQKYLEKCKHEDLRYIDYLKKEFKNATVKK